MKGNNYTLLYIFFFLIPFVYLGSEKFFLVARAMLIVFGVLSIVHYGAFKIIIKDPFLVIMLSVLTFFSLLHKKLYPFPTILIAIESYMFFSKSKIPFTCKHKGLIALKNGCLFSAIIGVLYMLSSGTIIRGGDFVTNSWGISNITVPLFLSFYIVCDVILTLEPKKNILVRLKRYLIRACIWIVAFLLIVLLGKRGPILFSTVSVIVALFVYNTYFKRLILSLLFLYPIWELPLITYITENLVDRAETIFDRMDDFENVDDNPRIIRLQAASVFITDFSPRDLIGYHEELILTKNPADVEHNHFHNFLLQLYYERGLICVISVFLVFLFYREDKSCKSLPQQCAFGLLAFLLFIGMNESLMLCGTAGEILFFVTYLYHKQVYVFEKNNRIANLDDFV